MSVHTTAPIAALAATLLTACERPEPPEPPLEGAWSVVSINVTGADSAANTTV